MVRKARRGLRKMDKFYPKPTPDDPEIDDGMSAAMAKLPGLDRKRRQEAVAKRKAAPNTVERRTHRGRREQEPKRDHADIRPLRSHVPVWRTVPLRHIGFVTGIRFWFFRKLGKPCPTDIIVDWENGLPLWYWRGVFWSGLGKRYSVAECRSRIESAEWARLLREIA